MVATFNLKLSKSQQEVLGPLNILNETITILAVKCVTINAVIDWENFKK